MSPLCRSSQAHCLLDHGSSAGQLDHSAEGTLPGERFGANQQCKKMNDCFVQLLNKSGLICN